MQFSFRENIYFIRTLSLNHHRQKGERRTCSCSCSWDSDSSSGLPTGRFAAKKRSILLWTDSSNLLADTPMLVTMRPALSLFKTERQAATMRAGSYELSANERDTVDDRDDSGPSLLRCDIDSVNSLAVRWFCIRANLLLAVGFSFYRLFQCFIGVLVATGAMLRSSSQVPSNYRINQRALYTRWICTHCIHLVSIVV